MAVTYALISTLNIHIYVGLRPSFCDCMEDAINWAYLLLFLLKRTAVSAVMGSKLLVAVAAPSSDACSALIFTSECASRKKINQQKICH